MIASDVTGKINGQQISPLPSREINESFKSYPLDHTLRGFLWSGHIHYRVKQQ